MRSTPTGRQILYSLGDFFYEQHYIERLPSEYYDRVGLGDTATPEDAMRLKRTGREAWEGLGAILEFGADSLHRIRTIPLDLGFDEIAYLPEENIGLIALDGSCEGKR